MHNQNKLLHSKEDISLADTIQRWGNATSIALFDQSCYIFSSPLNEGVIGYRLSRSCAVVFGDPVCPKEALLNLVDAFTTYCEKLGKSIVYIAASQGFTQWALEHNLRAAIEIGHEIILNPLTDSLTKKGAYASVLRNKYNQAMKANIVVKEYKGYDFSVEQALELLGEKWLAARRGLQIYLYQLNIFSNRENKRWFYAEQNNIIVGMIILNQINNYNGWVINMLMVLPDAPHFTSEYIVLLVLQALRAEKCNFLSVGTIPAQQLGKIKNLTVFSAWLVRSVYNASTKVFKLGDRQRYWKKFQPRKESSYLLFSKKSIRLSEIYGIITCMKGIK